MALCIDNAVHAHRAYSGFSESNCATVCRNAGIRLVGSTPERSTRENDATGRCWYASKTVWLVVWIFRSSS